MPDSQTNSGWDVLLDLTAAGAGTRNERLKRALRAAIRSGRLPTGAALPPSRLLAADLGCSRWVVTEAYAQLVAEGYLEARTGSGTRVSWAGPASTGQARQARAVRGPARRDLAPGLPDLRAFPRTRWAEALRTASAGATVHDLGYPDPAGHPGLRDVLVDYLQRSRAATGSGAQLLVTTSTTSAVRRLCRALVADGHTTMAVEDPGWTRLTATVRDSGLEPVPIGVDDEGLRSADLDSRAGDPRRPRRRPRTSSRAAWSCRRSGGLRCCGGPHRVDGLVLEDDYDAEFRYDRAPVSTMQGMDPRRVVLLGSLSKTLSPAIGIGWMLAPARWADALTRAESALPPTLDQLALARLLESGAYDRHLRRARRAFRVRRDLLVDELRQRLPDCEISGVSAGLHLVVHLPVEVPAAAVVRVAERRGVHVVDLDAYRMASTGRPALVLGYGNIADAQVPGAVAVLADAITEAR